MQMAAEKAEKDEDQAMALWLSDLDEDVADDKDWATMNGVGIQIENAPVEREREVNDERVDDKCNQSIPPVIESKQLPLVSIGIGC
jgi:hypothetical protein